MTYPVVPYSLVSLSGPVVGFRPLVTILLDSRYLSSDSGLLARLARLGSLDRSCNLLDCLARLDSLHYSFSISTSLISQPM